MKTNETPLTDEYLNSLAGIKEAETKDFFYARLKTRLANKQTSTTWAFPLKPVWMICSLAFFLLVNTIMIIEMNKTTPKEESTSIQSFANAYDQNISSY